jgi:predicted nucleotidyltransferase
MRLSKKVLSVLIEAKESSFGAVDFYLFGSRVDDFKKGGDVDLALDVKLSKSEFRKKKLQFLTFLLRKDFAYEVDLVDYNTSDSLLFNEIRNHSIKL